MDKLLARCLAIYCAIYAFEGPVRYGLNLIHADSLIFVRDIVLLVPVIFLGIQQFLQRKLHPAYLVYLGVVLLHGLVFYANFHLLPPAVMGAKVLLTTLSGAIVAKYLFKLNKPMLVAFLLIWLASCIGVSLDKLGMAMPWTALKTTIGDVDVDIGRDWQIEQESDAYRAAGFTRSSIHAANILPLVALLLIFNLTRPWARFLVGVGTLVPLFWTTQKGSLLAYVITIGIAGLFRSRASIPLRAAYLLFTLLAVALPVVLPGYYMNDGEAGGFSNMSFNLRVEMMWPHAWIWIRQHEIFPFGVGLGGISGGMQLFAMAQFNAADNIFVFMYAYFGMMALVYLGAALVAALKLPQRASQQDLLALSVLLFIMIYGCVLSMLEDQMSSLFVGAALGWVAYESKRQKLAALPTPDQDAKAAGATVPAPQVPLIKF